MGYIEDLRDKRLQEFCEELNAKKEVSDGEGIFSEDFSICSFSCSIKNGFELIKLLNKTIHAGKKFVKKNERRIKKLYSTFKSEIRKDKDLSEPAKKELIHKIKSICGSALTGEKQKLLQLRHLRRDLLLRTCNVFLYVFTVLFSVGCGALLYVFDHVAVKATVYPISALAIIAFVFLQVIYVIKYLKAVKADIRGSVLYGMRRAYSAALVVWWYFTVVGFVSGWDPQILLYIFAAIFVLYIIFMIYDMFLSSSLFDETESAISFIAAAIIGLFFFADSFGNAMVSRIGSWLMLLSCGFLTLLIIKKFLLDKRGVKNFSEVFYIFFIIATTVALTVLALYKLLWQSPADGQTADNTLFSAAVGVYAALLGGGLTLTGVAWTIKHSEIQRKEEERKKYRPFMELQNEVPTRMVRASQLNRKNSDDPNYDKNGKVHLIDALIKAFNVKNISESNIILEGVVLNGEYCAFDHSDIIAKGEAIQIQTTGNYVFPPSSENVNMDLIVSDILGNKYKLKCVLERRDEQAETFVTEYADPEANLDFQLFCVIAINLPILTEGGTKTIKPEHTRE